MSDQSACSSTICLICVLNIPFCCRNADKVEHGGGVADLSGKPLHTSPWLYPTGNSVITWGVEKHLVTWLSGDHSSPPPIAIAYKYFMLLYCSIQINLGGDTERADWLDPVGSIHYIFSKLSQVIGSIEDPSSIVATLQIVSIEGLVISEHQYSPMFDSIATKRNRQKGEGPLYVLKTLR